MSIVRSIERIGFGAMVGAVAVSIWILVRKPHNAGGEAIAAIAAGFIAGFIYCLFCRQTPLMAGLLIDNQLRLNELVSSAWLIKNRPAGENAVANSLVVCADRQCAQIRPWSIVTRRYEVRQWAGIGLSLAIAAVLCGIQGVSSQTGRHGAESIAQSPSTYSPRDGGESRSLFAEAIDRPLLLPDADDPNASQFGRNEESRQTKTADPNDRGGIPDNASSHTESSGKGGGAARTEARQPDSASPTAPIGAQNTLKGNSASEIAAAGGSGTSPTNVGKSEVRTTRGISSGPERRATAPPWQTSDWALRVGEARNAVSSGQIPAGYRDLVHEYFSAATVPESR